MRVPLRSYVILYHDQRNQHLVQYEINKRVNTSFGEVILSPELEYGKPLISSAGYSFYPLKPDTAYLSKRVQRKTTIVYPKDAGYILLELGIRSGMHVAEVGAGSGAMTLVLSNVVGKEGRVYSFERRQEFLELAQGNVSKFGTYDNIKFHLRDVEQEGFGEISVDAVFIDVPDPWNLAIHVHTILKPGHSVGIISPNIEQVQKTHEALNEIGFIRLRTYEIMHREIMVRPGKTRPRERAIVHTGYLLFGEKIVK